MSESKGVVWLRACSKGWDDLFVVPLHRVVDELITYVIDYAS